MFTNFLCVFLHVFSLCKTTFKLASLHYVSEYISADCTKCKQAQLWSCLCHKKISSPGHFSLKCGMYHSGY